MRAKSGYAYQQDGVLRAIPPVKEHSAVLELVGHVLWLWGTGAPCEPLRRREEEGGGIIDTWTESSHLDIVQKAQCRMFVSVALESLVLHRFLQEQLRIGCTLQHPRRDTRHTTVNVSNFKPFHQIYTVVYLVIFAQHSACFLLEIRHTVLQVLESIWFWLLLLLSQGWVADD